MDPAPPPPSAPHRPGNGCLAEDPPVPGAPPIEKRIVGALPDGRAVEAWTLRAGSLGLTALSLGGIVTRLWVPDRTGAMANVVLGFDRLADYIDRNPNFGVILGRYANRIAGGRFDLDGRIHKLTVNRPPNCLHGGERGFGKRLWTAEPIDGSANGEAALALRYVSQDGEEGFPGRLEATVVYRLAADNSWRIDYSARTDAPTVVNLSHHDYFNLAGGGTALGHRLRVAAGRYAAVDRHLVPEAVAPVDGTPFDFRNPVPVGARIDDAHPQLAVARGYDHSLLLDRWDGTVPQAAATLEDPRSGRRMTVLTTEPAIQVYSANAFDGSLAGTGGRPLNKGDGLCLETQHLPNSPNHRPDDADWPATVLRPGETFRSTTIHRFAW